jgi:hypothetical protein
VRTASSEHSVDSASDKTNCCLQFTSDLEHGDIGGHKSRVDVSVGSSDHAALPSSTHTSPTVASTNLPRDEVHETGISADQKLASVTKVQGSLRPAVPPSFPKTPSVKVQKARYSHAQTIHEINKSGILGAGSLVKGDDGFWNLQDVEPHSITGAVPIDHGDVDVQHSLRNEPRVYASISSSGSAVLPPLFPTSPFAVPKEVPPDDLGSVKVPGTRASVDQKLHAVMKRLGVNSIGDVEEVNLYMDNGDVIHLSHPSVQASIPSSTYVVSGHSKTKKSQAILPRSSFSL